MLENLYVSAKALERWRHSWLKEPVDAFVQKLADAGYKRSSQIAFANWSLALGELATKRRIRRIDRLPELVEPLLPRYKATPRCQKMRRAMLSLFVRHLLPEDAAAISQTAPSSIDPLVTIVEECADYLRNYRGLCEMRIRSIRRHCLALMTFLRDEGSCSLQDLNPEVIRRLITRDGAHYCRLSMRDRCTSFRGFLTFLHRRGVTVADWSTAIIPPRVYRFENCPRFLTRPEVEAVLAAIDRQTPQGKRDYAMLLLMSVYGLRGIEVRRLRLHEIDWRNEMIHIRKRKAGNNTTYPLATSVGAAIFAYLKHARPKCKCPQVFLSSRPPYGPLNGVRQRFLAVRRHSSRRSIDCCSSDSIVPPFY